MRGMSQDGISRFLYAQKHVLTSLFKHGFEKTA